MALIDTKWNPTTRELRVFAALWLVFFGLLGGWMYLGAISPTWGGGLLIVAVVGGTLGLLWPESLRPVYLLWMGLAFPIGWLVSHLILGLLFFGLLTPIGLLMRLAGHDPLRLKPDPAEASYWSERPAEADTSRYFRQF